MKKPKFFVHWKALNKTSVSSFRAWIFGGYSSFCPDSLMQMAGTCSCQVHISKESRTKEGQWQED
jgi:hypothetical protein